VRVAALLASTALAAVASGCAGRSAPVEAPMLGADDVASAITTTTSAQTTRGRVRSSGDRLDPATPFDRGDRFAGHYVCAQGRTELTLVIEDLEGTDVSAIFEFDYPGGGGANAPASGSFRMHGSFDPHTRALRLDGDRWLEQPDGYAMVGLFGTVSKTGSIDGTVKGPGCSTFYVAAPRSKRSASR
jgi:hypothetical protein